VKPYGHEWRDLKKEKDVVHTERKRKKKLEKETEETRNADDSSC